jgi:hypothetical protein
VRPRVTHAARPAHAPANPVLVTVRVRDGLLSLRRAEAVAVLARAFDAGSVRFGFRLAHYSVQINHLHLIGEAHDRRALARGIAGLLVRAARALNKLWKRRGRVFADHYHARPTKSPREVRHALRYVLCNARHHGAKLRGPDPYSSGPWFDGWSEAVEPPSRPSPVVAPKTWLLRVGWKRHGTIGLDECPGPDPATAPPRAT